MASYLRLRVDGSTVVDEIEKALHHIRNEDPWNGVLISSVNLSYDIFVPLSSGVRARNTRNYDFIREVEIVDMPVILASSPSDVF